jgi:hypothetical protein
MRHPRHQTGTSATGYATCWQPCTGGVFDEPAAKERLSEGCSREHEGHQGRRAAPVIVGHVHERLCTMP